MNEVIKALKERRSIRGFRPEPVEKEKIQQIIDTGLYAASGMGRQSAVIIAVTNKQLRDRIADANRRIMGQKEGFDPFYGAPAILIVLAKKDIPTYIYDGSLAMGNLMTAAQSLGLGSIWIHRAKEEFEQEEFKALLKDLGLEGEYEGIGHCALGYFDGDLPKAAARNEKRAFFVE